MAKVEICFQENVNSDIRAEMYFNHVTFTSNETSSFHFEFRKKQCAEHHQEYRKGFKI